MDSKLTTRSFLLSLLALIGSFAGFAQNEAITKQLYPTDLAVGKSYLLYDELSFDEGGQARNPIDFDFKEVRHVISLFTNPWLPAADQQYFKVDLDLELSNTKLPGRNVLSAIQLQISYDPEKGTSYQAKDSYTLEGRNLYAWLHVKGVRMTDIQGNAIPVPDKPLFFVRHQLQMERYFRPLKFQQPAFVSPENTAGTLHIDQKANGNIAIHWKPLKWAVAYDLEWTFVDDYDINSGFSRSPDQVIYNFKNNSTRVRLSDHHYEIPNVFERGYVLFRVRGVGKWGDDFEEIVEGNWSLMLFKWSIPSESPHLFVKVDGNTAHERDLKNWQYIANFAEEGKRKDLITYLDGSLRDRQIITNLSTDQQVLVAEKIYDHQGRPAIEILPSPVRRPTVGEQAEAFMESPALRFHPNFNQNEQGMAYSRLDFDRDPPSINQNVATPLGNESGAGNYYSNRNPEKNGHQAYVPDAGGYPFIHTEYMDDLTGRVRRQGGLGAQHQLPHPDQVGHHAEYFYSDPAQEELDIIFGNEVGHAQHYKKRVMFDENGAGYVSYTDLKGNVIASAHAGEAPHNLEAIEATEAPITIHLLEQNNQRMSGSNTLLAVKEVVLVKPSSMSFAYTLMPERFETQICPWSETICYDCVYDLKVLVRDTRRGTVLWEINETIGNLDELRNCAPQSFSRNHTTAVLPKGTYFIEKSLTVNPTSIERYLDDYFEDECMLEWRQRIKNEEKEKANDCETPCRPCALTEVPQEPFEVKDQTGNTRSINLPPAIISQLDGVCRTVCPENIPSPCVSARQLMLADVSPHGQFGQVEDQGNLKPESFKYSVYNENNELPTVDANWRNPRLGGYRNPDGSEALIRVRFIAGRWTPAVQNGTLIPRPDGTHWVRPQHLNQLEVFLANWQPNWAESLLAYHPEYCYLNWCHQQKESYDYDGLMLSKQKLTDAFTETDLSPLLDQDFGNDHIRDPFFSDHPNAVPILMDMLEHMLKDDQGLYGRDLNIVEAVKVTISGMNRNFSNSDITQYLSSHTLYSDPAKADKEWQLYVQLYSFAKRKVQDKIRESYVKQLGCFSNDCPDSNSGLCYELFVKAEEKRKRFPTMEELKEFCPPGENCGSPEQIARRNETKVRWECGTCPVGYDLLNLFNGFAMEERLTQTSQLPSSPPLTLTDRLLDAFSNNPTAKFYSWEPHINDIGNQLDISIRSVEDDQEVCHISLTKTQNTTNWKDFVQFNCLRPTAYVNPGESATDPTRFVMIAYDADFNQTEIEGFASCIEFTTCDLPEFCLRTGQGEELGILMSQLFGNGQYSSVVPYTLALGDYKPVFVGPNILQRFPNTDSLLYRQISRNGRYQKSLLYNTTTDGSPQRCTLDMFIVQSGFTYEEVARIIGVRVPDERPLNGSCSYNKMFLKAETATGQTFEIEITAPCFSLADCCFSGGEAPAGQYPSCCIPFNNRKIPNPPTCTEDNEELADNNTEIRFRHTIKRLRDEVRTAYVEQCLKAAETLQIEYVDRIYHYTLYYYDQAGNLVKTVPPKGVRKLNEADLTRSLLHRGGIGDAVRPEHKMATTYRYNSLNQVVGKYTPDGGYTRFCYDELGRPILSQDAHQAQQDKCTFIRYDEYGRIHITGKMNAPPLAFPKIMQQETYDQFFEAFGATTSEIFLTYYDEPLTDENSNFPFPFFETSRLYRYFKKGVPQNLRNRVAALVYLEGSIADFYQQGKPYTHAIYYSYDMLGNVNELLQEYKQMQQDHPALADADHHIKKIEYNYDLISGNINQVTYQPGQEDQFIHWYTYDADNRLVSVKTGRNEWEDEVLKEVDATYSYYRHGPMARVELGHEEVQGLDYAYTIQGWLKGVNSGTLSPLRDIGKDGVDAIHPHIPKDVYGYVLSYFDADYRPIAFASIGSENSFVPSSTGNQILHNDFSKPLYNGGIRNITTAIAAFEDSPVQATAYSYDQLNRLKRMEVFRSDEMIASNSNNWRGGSFVPDYESTFSYDANGNITSLARNSPSGNPMDQLSYTYANPDANLLSHIDDPVAAHAFDNDLDDQNPNNYYYDAKGRMKRDAAEGISTMEWTNTDKLQRIIKNGHTIDFDYSAHGHRLSKMSGDSMTYYVRDLEGNIMSTYRIKNEAVRWEDVPLYGSKRLGSWQPGLVLDGSFDASVFRYKRGKKRYELSSHLGNVNTTVSDRKYIVDNAYAADIQSAQDYYPFGMLMPGRNISASGYRFGFQGMEMDQDVKGEGNSYSTEFRQYDARVGRWLSLDALHKDNESNFSGFGNNPVIFQDPKGLDKVLYQHEYDQLKNEIRDKLMSELQYNGEGVEEELEKRVDYQINMLLGKVMVKTANSIEENKHVVNYISIVNAATTGSVEMAVEGGKKVGAKSYKPSKRAEHFRKVATAAEKRAITYAKAAETAKPGGVHSTEQLTRWAAQSKNEAKAARRTASSLAREANVARKVVPVLKMAGPLITVGQMTSNIYDEASKYANGDIGVAEYSTRLVLRIASGVAGLVPFGDIFLDETLVNPAIELINLLNDRPADY